MAGTAPSTKLMILNLWEYLAFLANSVVFLLIGLNTDLTLLWENLGAIVVAVVAVVSSRAILVYGFSWLARLWRKQGYFPPSWRHVLFWGGLRGAISLALALSLPVAMPGRSELQAMAFGVVLFTLLAQGTTIQFLLERLGLPSGRHSGSPARGGWAGCSPPGPACAGWSSCTGKGCFPTRCGLV